MQDNFLKRSSELSAAKQALLEKRLNRIASQTSQDIALPLCFSTTKGGKCPLSFAQQRLWFIQELDPESSVYNEPLAVRLHGPLNIAALTHVAQEITRRHEVLRSTFPSWMEKSYRLSTQYYTNKSRFELSIYKPYRQKIKRQKFLV